MTPESIIHFGQQALYIAMLIGGPLLVVALSVGLLVGMFQAATQINEMTLSFIPKLLAMILVLMIAGPWMLQTLVDFTRDLITNLPGIVR